MLCLQRLVHSGTMFCLTASVIFFVGREIIDTMGGILLGDDNEEWMKQSSRTWEISCHTILPHIFG